MFERYTEKARRAVFFARYEASQVGSPLIDTEHLLFGLLRDNAALVRSLHLAVDLESARQQFARNLEPGQTFSTNVDLPLSDSSKRVLMYAAEEAERLNHRHIGTEHLILGLVRDEEFASAKLLLGSGASLETLRKRVEAPEQSQPAQGVAFAPRDYTARHRPESPPNTVEIHGVRWNVEQVRAAQVRCRESFWHWERKTWTPRDVVRAKDGKTFSFDLGLAERFPEKFVLATGGWTKDYCTICRWELFETKDPIHGAAFTNGRDWICTECHQRFIAKNFFGSAYSEIT
jgi:hypothetical protein